MASEPASSGRSLGEQALVIGGGIAGLLAARVLADWFQRVMILDRDQFPVGMEPRSGVPQGVHGHGLCAGGHRALESLFPGLDAELSAHGAPHGDASADTAILLPSGWLPRFDSGLTSRACSRFLLEGLIRRRLARNSRVRFVEQQSAVGLLMDQGRPRVCGVIARGHGRAADRQTQAWQADLVVDASGRSSPAPQWLVDAGFGRVPETVIATGCGYACRRYRLPARSDFDWRVLVVYARPPDCPRHGAIMPEEEGRWVVALSGSGSDHPPTDEAGFLEFARRLADPELYNAIRYAEPLSPIRAIRQTENRLRAYERLSPWPERFLVLGDAACTFNPIYAQGMTVAALGALALAECLCQAQRRDGLDLLGRLFQRRLARIVATPWLMATSEDSRYAAATGGWRMRFVHWYVDRVVQRAVESQSVAQALLEVLNLVQPVQSLLRPSVLARVLWQPAVWSDDRIERTLETTYEPLA